MRNKKREIKKNELQSVDRSFIESLVSKKGLTVDILKNYEVPIDILEKNIEKLNPIFLTFAFKNQKLNAEFVEKYGKKVNVNLLISYCPELIPDKILRENVEKYSYDQWQTIQRECKLSEQFIRDNFSYLDSYDLVRMQKLSSDFLNEFKDKLPSYMIAFYQELTEEFMEQNTNSLSWEAVSQYQKFSLDFALRNANKLQLHSLKYNEKIKDILEDKEVYELLVSTAKLLGND